MRSTTTPPQPTGTRTFKLMSGSQGLYQEVRPSHALSFTQFWSSRGAALNQCYSHGTCSPSGNKSTFYLAFLGNVYRKGAIFEALTVRTSSEIPAPDSPWAAARAFSFQPEAWLFTEKSRGDRGADCEASRRKRADATNLGSEQTQGEKQRMLSCSACLLLP